MKVVTASTLSSLEKQAYQEGFQEEAFMEQAGCHIATAVEAYLLRHELTVSLIWVLCGKGNNGGDAFVAGRYLKRKGYKAVAIQLDDISTCTSLCQKNRDRFLEEGGQCVPFPVAFESHSLILDGLFGTGFKGKVPSKYEPLIEAVNQSQTPVLSIDIPSGLNGNTGEIEGAVMHATETLCLEAPKVGCFLRDGRNVVGDIQVVSFGLPHTLLEDAPSAFQLLTLQHALSLLPPLLRNRNKYQAGEVVGLAGSIQMPGAALLASTAAFRAGSGLVRLLHPPGMEMALSKSPWELIQIEFPEQDIPFLVKWLNKGKASFIGPGMGSGEKIVSLLKTTLPQIKTPCVLDADALNVFAKEPFALPDNTILTPHLGEMQRLLQSTSRLTLDLSLLNRCQEFAEKWNVTLVLKGATTFVFHPHSPIFANIVGDAGMATAGSGDVLTGMIASLLSQGLTCHHAALFGTFLHGLAGKLAVRARGTSYGLMASDIIEGLGPAYALMSTWKKGLHNESKEIDRLNLL